MQPIQAVFWDYDNTIFETAEAHWNKHQKVLARHGIVLSEIFSKRIYENNGDQNWEWLNKELGLQVPKEEYLKQVDAEFKNTMASLQMRPGVAEVFQLLRQLGIPQAIITNARRESAEPVLHAKGISSFMQFILFKEDYEGRKPAPTPYLVGFEKMSSMTQTALNPQKCIAIEDDPNGVKSAHQAGAIVIHRKLKEDEADSPYADYCCFHEKDFIRIMATLLKV
jgi:HAD superfamily hydrolase (TIGR01509 family)